jgi:SARP family transcriptional regulator, regulator of embCAB operon
VAELRILGPVEVLAHDGVVHAGEPRRLAVLAALTVDAGRVVSTTTLIDRVWGDDPPGQAARTLGTYITRIRRMLEMSFSDATVTVISQPGGYRLAAQPGQIDLIRFRELVVQARIPSCTPEERVDSLRRAVALHRGDPLTGVDGAWAIRTREQLTGELLTARAEWAEAEVALGNATAVLAPLTALADANPLVEPLVVALVRALVGAGRPTEALERCRLHRQRLADEYGTDPSPQLMLLYETVLRADPQPVGATSAKRSEALGAWVPAAPPPPPPARLAAIAGATQPGGADAGAAAGHSRAATAGAGGSIPAKPRRRHRRPFIMALAVALTLAVTVTVTAFRSPDGAPDGPTDVRFTATEDFSGPGLAPLQWSAHETPHNNGSSWSPSMVQVGGGELQIIGKGRSATGRGNMAGSVCWCLEGGVVRTYGVWEVRAKFDAGAGYGPVIGLYSAADNKAPGWGFMTLARIDDGDRRTMYPVMQGAGGASPIDGGQVNGDFTAWNTYSIEWRADFVTFSLNGAVIFDTRKLSGRVTIPSVPMFLYVQVIPGPDGPVPAPNLQTPDQVATHVDWAKYTS